MRLLTGVVLIILVSCSCRSERKPVDIHFDLDERVQIIIDQLDGYEYSLTKLATMDGVEESTSLTDLDSARWARELELFSSANINQPQFQGVYEIFDRPDENSNLTVRRYEHIEPMDANIPWMEVRYLNKLENCKSVTLEYREKNTGFSVFRILSMNFEDIRGENLLKDYSVKGYQKIFGQDTVKFFIQGELSY